MPSNRWRDNCGEREQSTKRKSDPDIGQAMAASRYAIGSAAFAEKTDARIEEVVAVACRIGILICRGGPFP